MNDIKGIIEDVEKSSLVSNKVIKKVIEIIGQEKWQEIYDEEDDICTTTGELSITLSGIEDLEKENAESKCECRTCVYTDSPCVRSDYPSKDGVCSHYKNVFDENAELKQENKVLAQNLEDTEILNKTYEKRFKELEKENAELKKLKRECETSLCRAEYQYNYEQLTKAKNILNNFLNACEDYEISEARLEAEQFLKDCEVEK